MRKILHLDLDCFYAAVELKYRPDLRGKPIAVGGRADSRGVITTASYEARKFGVRSAIPSSRAVRLCPELILIPPHFELYRQESRAIRQIFERYTDKIQPLSLDEAYLDVTEIAGEPGAATRIAREIKEAVKKERNLIISAGVAPNKFLAKIASDWKKPDGLFVIPPEKVAAFMIDLPIEKIHGVGKVTAEKMHGLGLKTCGDIQAWSIDKLRAHFGSRGADLYRMARGEDDREVHDGGERKSLSVEETFREDLASWPAIKRELAPLYDDWLERMRKSGAIPSIHGAVVKMKFADFKTSTHERSIRELPSLEFFENLAQEAWEKRAEPIRLLGVGARLGGTSRSASSSVLDTETDQLSFLSENESSSGD